MSTADPTRTVHFAIADGFQTWTPMFRKIRQSAVGIHTSLVAIA